MHPRPLPRWFAHRGGGSLAPENTLAGIRLAASLGYKAVEFDVMLSADGTPVLIHDETLERTTNGRGDVCATPDARLFALDAGQGERIPRFVDAAALCIELGLLANVEIKPAAGHDVATAEAVSRLSADLWRGAAVQPLLSSFSLEALEVARDLAPGSVAACCSRNRLLTGVRNSTACAQFRCIAMPTCSATRFSPRPGRMTSRSCVTRSTRRSRQNRCSGVVSAACLPIVSIFLPNSCAAGRMGCPIFF